MTPMRGNRAFDTLLRLTLVVAVIFIITGHVYPIAPFENMDLSRPLALPLLVLIGAIVIYSWWCCGSDHKDEPEFPIGKRGWWKKEEKQNG